MTPTLIIEHGIAECLSGAPFGVRVVARRKSPWWRRRRSPWAPLDPEAVLDVLVEIRRPAVVLARSAAADPGARCLGDIARLLGLDVRTLPDDRDEAAWCVGVAGSLGEALTAGDARALDVLCCGSVVAPGSPRGRWGATGISVPVLRPGTIARWASCAWRACRWCAAGGLPGDRCRRCGSPIDALAPKGRG